MLRKCPSHGFDELTQIPIFRNGLQPQPKLFLDATGGGSLMAKTTEEEIMIIEKMARNDHQVQHNRGVVQKKPGLIELGTNDAILAQNKLLSQQVEELTKQMASLPQQLKEMQDPNKKKQVALCELCSGDHPTGYCLLDILTKKRSYTEPETVILDAKCSAIIQCTLPGKERDPGRVTFPVTIGDIHVGRGLVDLGSSINLIPLSMVKRLGIIDMKDTRMTLQLADKYTTRPYGIAEDLLVKVDKFLFLVDFVVIDMKEDVDTPLILGRPFMKTHPNEKGDCFRIDVTEEAIMNVERQVHLFTPLEKTLTNAREVLNEDEEKEIEECLRELEASEEINPFEGKIEELKDETKIDNAKLELKMLL
ncbi:uncharacterized protein LOC131594295 [Vicia villosa]|uniref:uncharacterized protein LOC131594295 n=1 Tax=Vicia villosa TaxID=3911 RepID=UPI00273B376F|nr:uncharacterized protein LOC131594295 [Vicia villosa]